MLWPAAYLTLAALTITVAAAGIAPTSARQVLLLLVLGLIWPFTWLVALAIVLASCLGED